MKKKMISLVFASIFALSAFAGCGEKTSKIDMTKAPDTVYGYSSGDAEFLTYAYHSPTDGYWFVGEENYYAGQDFRTQERYEEYRDCGLNTLMLQGNDPYGGEDFETSQLKKNMDNAYAAGIQKIIVFDTRINYLSSLEQEFIGNGFSDKYSGRTYDTEADVVEWIKECLEPYRSHPAFFGVMLHDEPSWKVLPQTSLMYKLVERAWSELAADQTVVLAQNPAKEEGIYVQSNLLPLDPSAASGSFVDPNGEYGNADQYVKYEQYIRTFVEISEADRICMDSYPIRETMGSDGKATSNSYSITATHFPGLRILQKIAKEYGCELAAVAGTTRLGSETVTKLKGPNRSEMYWQINAYMGFGVQGYSYYTYWAKRDNSVSEEHTDGTAFITRMGEKTSLWYTMQKIHSEMQAFAPVIMNFTYQGMRYYVSKPTSFATSHLTAGYTEENPMDEFTALKNVEVATAQQSLVTELKDENNGQYMYMLMNPNAPSNAVHGDVSLNATMDFGKNSGYHAVEIWYKGEKSYRALVDGKVDFELAAGYAVYVMPF